MNAKTPNVPEELAVTIVEAVGTLPPHHSDPFDRLIIETAQGRYAPL